LGGAIYCLGAAPQIIGCVIVGNVAGGYHGAGGGGGIWAESSNLTLENCTIAHNSSAGGSSGGIELDLSNASITRTIIWDNCGGEFPDFQGSATLTCCDTDTTGFDPSGIQFNGPQVHADPLFCDPRGCGTPETGGDYYLRVGSPCLPGNSPCGALIGALGEGCGGVPIDETTWGRIKATFR
jgi:hypothetical protein